MGSTQRKRQPKPCNRCAQNRPVLFRIKTGAKSAWVFFCSDCQTYAKTLPEYEYGGTWKQSKRN